MLDLTSIIKGGVRLAEAERHLKHVKIISTP